MILLELRDYGFRVDMDLSDDSPSWDYFVLIDRRNEEFIWGDIKECVFRIIDYLGINFDVYYEIFPETHPFLGESSTNFEVIKTSLKKIVKLQMA